MKYFSILVFCMAITIVAPDFTFADDQKIMELDKKIETLEKQRDELNKQIQILEKERSSLDGEDPSLRHLRDFGNRMFPNPQSK